VAGWVIETTPPEMLEEEIRKFNEEEFRAQVREIEQTGGVRFQEFIGEIEGIVKRRD
jgi:hypothetical protein